MNESKVVVYDVKIRGEYTMVVTHAEYKALEEVLAEWKSLTDDAEAQLDKTREELASLKARVRELVESDKAMDELEAKDEYAVLDYQAVAKRRSIALEALK